MGVTIPIKVYLQKQVARLCLLTPALSGSPSNWELANALSPSWIVWEPFCFGANRRASANDFFSFSDPVSERRVGERDSAPAQEHPTSPGRAPEKKAKDDSRRVVKSAQDLSDVSMDEVGIPLRVQSPS